MRRTGTPASASSCSSCSTPGIRIQPIVDLVGHPGFNEVFFDDVVVEPDCLLGAEGEGWKQVTSELSLERSGPERYLSSFALFVELVRLAGRVDSEALRHAIGRLSAELWTLRQMSLSVAGQLAAGEDPMLAAAIVKDLGNTFEQSLPAARPIARRRRHPARRRQRPRAHARTVVADLAVVQLARRDARDSARHRRPRPRACADMSEQRQLLSDSAARLFESRAAVTWDEIDEIGIADILVPDERGGSGADWDDACAVLQAAGRWQIPLPLAEAMIARKLIAEAALEVPRSSLSIAPNPVGTLSRDARAWKFSGTLSSVPWGRDVAHVVTTVSFDGRPHVVVLAVADASVHKRTNLADEPRDDLKFDGAPALAAPANSREAQSLFDYAALARTAQIAGALQSALERSIAYALERKQFGRPIGQFQAVQQQLALFGAEVAAATCASRSAGIAAERRRCFI